MNNIIYRNMCVITNNTIFIFVLVVVELNDIINHDTYYALIIIYQVYSNGLQIVEYNMSTYILSRWLWNNIMCFLP